MAISFAPVVRTSSGPVRGKITDEGVAMYRGIPYARAGRWQPPRPPEAWDAVRDALRPGPAAPQNPSPLESAWGQMRMDTSEDCLSLNIWTPAPDGAGRPVLVWIHGGGFTGGTGATPWYDGRRLAHRGDVVVVTINYRLGVLGFLELSGVAGEGFAHSGNCGLLDQVAALRWVQDNIAAFGGDPGRVTVFGESAGAMSVGTLLGMPAADGLFARAILQSGASSHVTDVERAREVAARVLDAAGLTGAPPDRLLAADVETLLQAQAAVERARTGARLPFGPVAGTVDLPRPPLDVVASGGAAGVAVMAGTNAEEMTLFTLADPGLSTLDEAGLLDRLARTADITGDLRSAVAQYQADYPGRTPGQLWVQMATDQVFRVPAIRLLEAQVGHQPDVWAYLFTVRSTAFGGVLGATHALEIPFVFGTLDRPGVSMFVGEPEGAAEVAEQMQEAWIAFATTGDPGWPRYDAGTRATREFGGAGGVLSDPGPASRRIWA